MASLLLLVINTKMDIIHRIIIELNEISFLSRL